VQTDLTTLGLTVTVAAPDWQTVWLPEVHSGRADLFLLGWTGINGDPDAFLCPLFCGLEAAFDADDTGRPVPPDEELLGLLQDARTTITLTERERLYAEAYTRLAETMPAVPLAYRQTAWAMRLDVQGYTPSPIDSFFGQVYQAP
jgi:peptide/nickel transport system substrate-binding protein